MIKTLIVKQSLANLDQDLLEEISRPEAHVGKKGEILQKDESLLLFYIIPTNMRVENNNLLTNRFNAFLQEAQIRHYSFIMITLDKNE